MLSKVSLLIYFFVHEENKKFLFIIIIIILTALWPGNGCQKTLLKVTKDWERPCYISNKCI